MAVGEVTTNHHCPVRLPKVMAVATDSYWHHVQNCNRWHIS